jgi:hypothetical protein
MSCTAGRVLIWAILLAAIVAATVEATPAQAAGTAEADAALLHELQKRCVLYFWEQGDPRTGLVLDRAGADGGPSASARSRDVASIAATGFGLTALCVAERRGWLTREEAYARVLTTLRFLADKMPHERGFFYHFADRRTGERAWRCELSSIDTALLMAGVLTVRQHYRGTEVERLATELYGRVDWPWMLAGGETLSMGWKPEGAPEGRFLAARWDRFSEHPALYLLALGSRTHPLPPEAWRAWKREPAVTYAGRTFLQHPPLFVHQFPHAWFDFRGRRDFDDRDFWKNSVDATLAHRQFCIDLGKGGDARFAHYGESLWGITSSDSAKGYVGWGGPPATGNLDGTVVPCAAAGSLPFAPDECLQALRHMRRTYGDRTWKRYGFVDAFNPATGWVGPDVIGIDAGITLLMAENYRTGWVWECFGGNEEVRRAFERAGFRGK